MIYFAFTLIFIIFSFFDFSKDKALKRTILFFLFLIIILFIGLRFHTGQDWAGYIYYFKKVNWNYNVYQPGFKLLNIICKNFFDNYWFVQFVSTVFFTFCAFIFFLRYSDFPFTAIFLYLIFCFQNLFMAQIRQSLAVSFILLGSKYIIDKKFIKYLFFVLIGYMFHISAVFGILTYFLTIKINKKIRIILLFSSLFLMHMSGLVPIILLWIAKIINGEIGYLIISYLTSKKFSGGLELGSGLFFYLRFILAFIILLFSKPKTIKEHCALNGICAFMILNALSLGFGMLERLEFYFNFFTVLGWLQFLSLNILKSNKNFYLIFLILFMAFFSISFLKPLNGLITAPEYENTYYPYYNCISYPPNAEMRGDWSE